MSAARRHGAASANPASVRATLPGPGVRRNDAATGLLLFAHGARDPAWARPFEDLAGRLRRAAPQVAVELAFLEFMRPTLLEAGERLARAGCADVAVVPLFLGAGGHVRKDVPDLLSRLQAAHRAVRWTLTPPIGESAVVVEAMARAALEALDGIIAPPSSAPAR